MATETKEPKEGSNLPAVRQSAAEITQLAKWAVDSGMYPGLGKVSAAAMKILRGAEMGVGPAESLENINVIQGRTALAAGLIAAKVKQSGRYDYRVTKHTDTECEIEFYDGGKKIGESAFTMKDAEKAGLAAKDNWKHYPRNMLFSRALTNGARWYCPDVFGGSVYTPDELTDVIEGELVTSGAAETETTQTDAEEPRRCSDKQADYIRRLFAKRGYTARQETELLQKHYGAESPDVLSVDQASEVIERLKADGETDEPPDDNEMSLPMASEPEE